MGIVVNMSLRVQNLSGFKQFASALGQLLSVFMCDPHEFILRQLLLGEKERPNMVKVGKVSEATYEVSKLATPSHHTGRQESSL